MVSGLLMGLLLLRPLAGSGAVIRPSSGTLLSMSTPLNYRHLYYFWVVAKEGGMARAAARLDMAVQTVSAQVRSLEQ